MKRSMILLLLFSLLVPALFLGCEGDDGPMGPEGPPGPPGTSEATPETCEVCHNDVASIHEITENVTVKNIASNLVGGNLEVTFNIQVDGVNNDGFTPLYRAYVHFDNAALGTKPPLITTFQRDTITSAVVLTSLGSGNYKAVVPAANVIDNSNYLFVLTYDPVLRLGGVSHEAGVWEADVNVQYGAAHLRDLVTSSGCAKCHGPYPARSEKFAHYAVGGAECQLCHSQASRATAYITRTAAGGFVETDNVFGTNLTEYVHGIHNSHNMPPDRTYYRRTTPGPENWYSVGYPSSMLTCVSCHRTEAQLNQATSAPLSYYLCMSCHNNWDGFVVTHSDPPKLVFGPTDIHRTLDINDNCMTCHAVLNHANEASDFHNHFDCDLAAPDAHYDQFYKGKDVSFENADNVTFRITKVTLSGDNVTFNWVASKNSAAVNPCNTDINAGPLFNYKDSSGRDRRGGLGAYLAYAKGDDWVNEFVGTSPGQPAGASNLFFILKTTCDNTTKVATTTGLTLDPDAKKYASKALLALNGKAIDQDEFLLADRSLGVNTLQKKPYFIREASPTYAFSMKDGSAIDPDRRGAVDSEKCLDCHQGTLYQHGGDRVDNEQLCAICHNPSAGEKNVRQVTYAIVNSDGSVNTSATYDGKVNETYDMRYMIHAIHGIEKRGVPLVIYRSRGIYAFVNPGTTPPEGWPLVDGEPPPVSADTAPVFGSTNGSTQIHNWTVVHYPKWAKECLACHQAGKYEVPDQTKAVALTVDPGVSFEDQSDDIVTGPGAAACTACHATASTREHARQFGYYTNVTKEEMLEKAQP